MIQFLVNQNSHTKLMRVQKIEIINIKRVHIIFSRCINQMNIILILLSILLSLFSSETKIPINGTLVFRDNIYFIDEFTINLKKYPAECYNNDIKEIMYEVIYQIEIKNNHSNTFIMVIPFYDWNKLCINICADDIQINSEPFDYLSFKSYNESCISYNIIIHYTCYYSVNIKLSPATQQTWAIIVGCVLLVIIGILIIVGSTRRLFINHSGGDIDYTLKNNNIYVTE